MRRDSSIGLDFDEEVRVERVRDFVTGEEDLRHREELAVYDDVGKFGLSLLYV